MSSGTRSLGARPPKNDVYTALLAISLLALIAGSVLMYLDYDQYNSVQPDAKYKAIAKPPEGGSPAVTPKPDVPPNPTSETTLLPSSRPTLLPPAPTSGDVAKPTIELPPVAPATATSSDSQSAIVPALYFASSGNPM